MLAYEWSLEKAFEASGLLLDEKSYQEVEENQPREKIGELVIIYNENMEFVDENWILEIDSSLIKKR